MHILIIIFQSFIECPLYAIHAKKTKMKKTQANLKEAFGRIGGSEFNG